MSNDKKMSVPPEAPKVDPMASTIKDIISELLPAFAALTKQTPQPTVPASRGPATFNVCTVCQQNLAACGDKHADFVAFPVKYPEFGDFFQGLFVNGVKYISNDEAHSVKVPEACVPYLKQMIAQFEEQERIARTGRNKTHHSGSLGRPTPAQIGWR